MPPTPMLGGSAIALPGLRPSKLKNDITNKMLTVITKEPQIGNTKEWQSSVPDKMGEQGQFSKFLHKNIYCDPSLGVSWQEGSNEGSQHMFPMKNNEKYLRIVSGTPSYTGVR